MNRAFDVIVVGAGHAGCEAALASARLGCKTLLITLKIDKIGFMSCNPAIGGVGKGQLVKEVDALGGEMGKAIDATGIQFRILNTGKGPAVQAPRAQADRFAYEKYLQDVCMAQDGLDIHEEIVEEILVDETGKSVRGVRTRSSMYSVRP